MSKDCELCGKPLNEWPQTRIIGEHRAWLLGAVAAMLAVVALGGTCAIHDDRDTQQKTERFKACLQRTDSQTCINALHGWTPGNPPGTVR